MISWRMPKQPDILEGKGSSFVVEGAALRQVLGGASAVKLSRGSSIFLDMLRFGAACTVLLSHLSIPGISSGLPNLARAGHLAVGVFFVLSGFVIRYVTLTRERSPRRYLIDRVSRMYSVIVPALVLTVLCEYLASLFPYYYALGGHPMQWSKVPFQLAANLTFQAQDWGYEIRPLSNAPFWSLSFECFYYAIYGIAFYRVRGSRFLCFLLLLVAGPSIALMLLVWLLGCFAFDGYLRLRRNQSGLLISSGFLAGMLLLLFSARGRFRELLLYVDEQHRTDWLSRLMLQVPHHELFFVGGRVPWLAYATPSFYVVGVVTAVVTIWSLLLIDHLRMDVGTVVTGWFRLLADSTFTLYLVHVPILILVVSVLGKPIRGWWFSFAIFCLTICIGVLLSMPFDTLKRNMRSRMEKLR